MTKQNEQLKDRRTDFHRRVQVAIRKAHDPLFANLVTPKAPVPERPRELAPLRIIRHT